MSDFTSLISEFVIQLFTVLFQALITALFPESGV